MANDIRICHKCRFINLKTIVPKIEKMAPDAEIQIGCKSYCGPCTRGAFVFINGRYVKGDTEDEALAKAAKYVKQPVS